MAVPARHRAFDPVLARRICERIAAGEMLRDLWRDPALPSRLTLKRWRETRPAFAAALRAAVHLARSRRYAADSPYDDDTAQLIVDRICGGRAMRNIAGDPDMPCLATLYAWLRSRPDFRHAVAMAREIQAEALVGRADLILAAMTQDTVDEADRQLRQIRWIAGRLSPKKYGA